jgi:hypothetical protein
MQDSNSWKLAAERWKLQEAFLGEALGMVETKVSSR